MRCASCRAAWYTPATLVMLLVYICLPPRFPRLTIHCPLCIASDVSGWATEYRQCAQEDRRDQAAGKGSQVSRSNCSMQYDSSNLSIAVSRLANTIAGMGVGSRFCFCAHLSQCALFWGACLAPIQNVVRTKPSDHQSLLAHCIKCCQPVTCRSLL